MDLDGGVGGVDIHFLFDDHAVLNVFAARVDLLTGDEPVQLGILGHAPDIGSQKHMGDAEIGQALLALLADVTVDVGDLKGLLEEVGGDVPLPLEVGGNLRHGGQGADAPAVGAVAPGGVILAIGMDPDSEAQQQAAQEDQVIRQVHQHSVGDGLAAAISHKAGVSHGAAGSQEHGDQQPGPADASAGEDGVQQTEEQNAGAVHGQDEAAVADDMMGTDGVENAHQPNGDSGFIEHFFSHDQGDEHIQQGGCHRQNDLTPHFKRAAGPFQTGERNAGHCRADQAKCHQPCQRVFTADK